MPHFIVHDSDGRIITAGWTSAGEISDQETAPEHTAIEHEKVDGNAYYVSGGVVCDRPTPNLVALPSGTTVEAFHLDLEIPVSGEIAGELIGLLEIPGRWHLCITPPWPFQTFEGTVHVD